MSATLLERCRTIERFDLSGVIDASQELGELTIKAYNDGTEPFYTGHNLIGNRKVPNALRKLWIHPPINTLYCHLRDNTSSDTKFKELSKTIMDAAGEVASTVFNESVVQIYLPGATLMRHSDPNTMTMKVTLLGSGTTTAWRDALDESPVIIESSVLGDGVAINGNVDHSVRNDSPQSHRVVLSLVEKQ